jgi:hypothetical protein
MTIAWADAVFPQIGVNPSKFPSTSRFRYIRKQELQEEQEEYEVVAGCLILWTVDF